MISQKSVAVLSFMLYFHVLKFLKANQTTFSIEMDEKVAVVGSMTNIGCFNQSASLGNSTKGELITFKLARGVLANVGYDAIKVPDSGETLLSLTVDYKCCSVFCERFSRQISDGKWVFGKVSLQIEEESNVGISYNGVQVCHSSYLEGVFGQTVNFSPFVLEGKTSECIVNADYRKYKRYKGVGRVIGITAVSSSSTLTVRFAFALSMWSKDFLLKFMKENEHGTLGNILAEVVILKAQYELSGLSGYGKYFMGVTAFAYSVVFFAIVMLVCSRTKRAFLKQTWISYQFYMKMPIRKTNGDLGIDNIALQNIN